MKKFFTFFAAALMSVSMFGFAIQEDIPLDEGTWGWSYDCTRNFNDGIMTCTLTNGWGAAQTGWNTADLSGWDRIVIVVENMNGCDGEWFKLKAYLRDYVNKDQENGQMEATLGLDAEDNQQHYMVINLKEEGKNVNLTACGVLGIQCQPNGAVFKISRVYLEKEVPFELGYGEDKWLKVVPEDVEKPYFVFIEDKEYYDNRYRQYDQETMQGLMDYDVSVVVGLSAQSSFVFNGAKNINPDPIYHTWYDSDHLIVNKEYVAFVFYFENDARLGNVEYLVFKYAGEPQGIENTAVSTKTQKVVRDGQVLILKNGKTYNALGAEVK